MIQKQLIVGLIPGLESRMAVQFVQKASSFSSNIFLMKNEKKMAAKSIIGIMVLMICRGDSVTLIADGIDEEKAVTVLSGILINEFDE
ncbi:HPr family phosphocarrier protein [Domibacillus indicus]|uniref:HPr family phosphocarrier protein n=1 Tax=Domibacillus indicus TaxID=1437523 RepID=UPI0006180DF0|nr:HPr family phosphocarrier protein [Domibacillus indicus]